MIENGYVVRRVGFKTKAIVGRPEITIKYLQKWNIDEIFFINVGKKEDITSVLNAATKKCFIPITVGGNIESSKEAINYIKNGADKVVIGKHANEKLLNEITMIYGDQAVCLTIDKDHYNIPDWPCGELIIHETSRDGMGTGLNIDILKQDTKKPIIAMGGVGKYEDIVEGLEHCDAVAVGNLFHFKEISARKAKEVARNKGLLIRS